MPRILFIHHDAINLADATDVALRGLVQRWCDQFF